MATELGQRVDYAPCTPSVWVWFRVQAHPAPWAPGYGVHHLGSLHKLLATAMPLHSKESRLCVRP